MVLSRIGSCVTLPGLPLPAAFQRLVCIFDTDSPSSCRSVCGPLAETRSRGSCSVSIWAYGTVSWQPEGRYSALPHSSWQVVRTVRLFCCECVKPADYKTFIRRGEQGGLEGVWGLIQKANVWREQTCAFQRAWELMFSFFPLRPKSLPSVSWNHRS